MTSIPAKNRLHFAEFIALNYYHLHFQSYTHHFLSLMSFRSCFIQLFISAVFHGNQSINFRFESVFLAPLCFCMTNKTEKQIDQELELFSDSPGIRRNDFPALKNEHFHRTGFEMATIFRGSGRVSEIAKIASLQWSSGVCQRSEFAHLNYNGFAYPDAIALCTQQLQRMRCFAITRPIKNNTKNLNMEKSLLDFLYIIVFCWKIQCIFATYDRSYTSDSLLEQFV